MTITDPGELALGRRAGLPDALRVLLEVHPRPDWEAHGNFGPMVQFWLQRHLMFREVLDRIEAATEGFVDGGLGVEAYAPQLSRYGGFFLNELHGHHQIEDRHYFPRLVGLEPRLERGFGMLEADHLAIDPLLADFAGAANAVLGAEGDPAAREAGGAFLGRVVAFRRLLDRHLTDEEELIVPVILETGFEG